MLGDVLRATGVFVLGWPRCNFANLSSHCTTVVSQEESSGIHLICCQVKRCAKHTPHSTSQIKKREKGENKTFKKKCVSSQTDNFILVKIKQLFEVSIPLQLEPTAFVSHS